MTVIIIIIHICHILIKFSDAELKQTCRTQLAHKRRACVETKNNSTHQMESVEMHHLNLIDANI